jgi:hypothetical protein
MFSILRAHWFTKIYNISVYILLVMHLPEDGHMSGRNMYEVLLRL